MAAIDKEYLARIVRDELHRAVGFDETFPSDELSHKRLIVQEYYNGDMNRDMRPMENRSGAVSFDIRDAILTTLPHLMAIVEDEDVFAFRPAHPEDVDGAQEATDYINHVFFQENDGFSVLYQAFHDALLVGIGYFTIEWEEPEEAEQETFKNKSQLDLLIAHALVEAGRAVLVDLTHNEDGTCDYTLEEPAKEGRLRVFAWNPGDVAVSVDTVKLGDGTFCSFRRRVRRFELVNEGFDEDLVADVPRAAFMPTQNDLARDQAGEHYLLGEQSAVEDMDTVQVYYNYVRVPGSKKIQKVITGGENENFIVLKTEEVDYVPAASIVPYRMPHRLFGMGQGELLIETQRNKTAQKRLLMDQGYYQMIGRVFVDEEKLTNNTIPDLMYNNVPGGFVRGQEGAVSPMQTAPSNYPGLEVLEYLSTEGELTSGVMRASQGLNADSLHETKGGALALLNQSQMRTRFILKTFCETGIRDLVLKMYRMIRENASMAKMIPMSGGQFKPIDPTNWGSRDAVDITVGTMGGRDVDAMGLTQVLNVMEKVFQMQGGAAGPIANVGNAAYVLRALTKAMGRKDGDMIWADPAQAQQMAQQQAQQAAQQPKQDPETIKAQMQAQVQAQKTQADAQHSAQRLQLEQAQAEAELQLQAHKAQQDYELQKYRIELEIEAKTWQVEQELKLKEQEIMWQAQLEAAAQQQNAKADVDLPTVYPGGNIGG